MEALLLTAGVLFLYMCGLFAISIVRADNGTADIGYGLGVLVSVVSAAVFSGSTSIAWLPVALVAVWAFRLSIRIYFKNRGKPEDFRYSAWRQQWGSQFYLRSFMQIYMLQGGVIFLIALPVLLSLVYPSLSYWPLVLIGTLLWVLGFVFEAVADYQLDRFIASPAPKGKILMSGLWKYSRHPNYFGESMMWWGIAILCTGLSLYPVLGFISPILITYLLLYVSGIPMLEKRWKGNLEWEAYAQRTSAFIPWAPRR